MRRMVTVGAIVRNGGFSIFGISSVLAPFSVFIKTLSIHLIQLLGGVLLNADNDLYNDRFQPMGGWVTNYGWFGYQT